MSNSERISTIKSKTSEVIKYLNEENLGGKRKQEPVEKSERAGAAYWIRESRNLERLQKTAEIENPKMENKIFKLEKENSELRLILLKLEQLILQTQFFSRNSLLKLFNSKKITKLQIKIEEILAKTGSMEEIESKISKNKIQLDLLKKKYYKNQANLTQEKPKPATEILEDYYEGKLDEFQVDQKQKLELINSQPVPLAEIVEKYNVFLMHGINLSIGLETIALQNTDFKNRLMINMLRPAVSSFSYGKGIKSIQMWSDCGVVFGPNTNIYWASTHDLHTKLISFRKRVPSYSPTRIKTIREEINSAIEDRNSYGINEFVVVGEPAGFWINADYFQLWSRNMMGYIRQSEPKILVAQKLGLPLFISMDGKLYKTEYIPVNKVIAKRQMQNPNIEEIANYEDCFLIGEEVKPQEIMQMKSPITREKQIEIAKKLTEKGVFAKDQLPNEFFD